MKSIAILSFAATVALSTAALAASPQIHPKPKLTLAQARAIALKVAPGKISEGEYEKEKGAWRYSFDIRQGNRIHEIGVDPNTGKIIENDFEGTHDSD